MEFVSGVLNASTQQATITIASAGTVGNATITAVILAQTMMFWGGYTTSAGNANSNNDPYAQLTTTTNIALTRQGSAAFTSIAVLTAVVFKSADAQSSNHIVDTIPNSTASKNTTITAVVVAKTAISYLGQSGSSTTTTEAINQAAVFVAGTTAVTEQRNSSASATTLIVGCNAMEFK